LHRNLGGPWTGQEKSCWDDRSQTYAFFTRRGRVCLHVRFRVRILVRFAAHAISRTIRIGAYLILNWTQFNFPRNIIFAIIFREMPSLGFSAPNRMWIRTTIRRGFVRKIVRCVRFVEDLYAKSNDAYDSSRICTQNRTMRTIRRGFVRKIVRCVRFVEDLYAKSNDAYDSSRICTQNRTMRTIRRGFVRKIVRCVRFVEDLYAKSYGV
jgi:hypothetical protein